MRALLMIVAGFLIISGGLWWLDGGSGVLGPIIAGLGVALVIVVVQNTRA
ncbi:hypothetical protein [Nocardioides deserti]|uniref:Uncharacterized protein n=1 Tax=Nocardioides deserti TaxID=1588644 RepID=A0ABR6UBJ4_9ACTN|nr:hypothetical protein [Nocardioides deserti]MBC2961815.1 hypothetical protein [Nocardioides deserti]GGO79371.1 hypothetical protein GCM10012276_38960 [Nocardioides deserti]